MTEDISRVLWWLLWEVAWTRNSYGRVSSQRRAAPFQQMEVTEIQPRSAAKFYSTVVFLIIHTAVRELHGYFLPVTAWHSNSAARLLVLLSVWSEWLSSWWTLCLCWMLLMTHKQLRTSAEGTNFIRHRLMRNIFSLDTFNKICANKIPIFDFLIVSMCRNTSISSQRHMEFLCKKTPVDLD